MVYGRSNGPRASAKRITLPLESCERADDALLLTGRREAKDGTRRPSHRDALPDRNGLESGPGREAVVPTVSRLALRDRAEKVGDLCGLNEGWG